MLISEERKALEQHFLIIFKGMPIVKNCFRTKSEPLKHK